MFSKKSANKSHNKNLEPPPKGAILTPPENLYIPESHFVPENQYVPEQQQQPQPQQQYITDQQQQYMPAQDNSYMPGEGTGYLPQESAYLQQESPYYSPEQQPQGNQQMDSSANMGQQQQQQYPNTINASQLYHNSNASQPPHIVNPSQPPHPNKPSESPSQYMPPNMPQKASNSMIYPIDSVNVKILFDGYSKFVDGDYFANCTCSLIKGGPNIVIDTMTVWDEEKLVRSLRNEGLSCDDIDFVICTHGHSDHTGCNHLFKNAIHIVGFSISHKDQYYLHPDFRHGEEFNIDPSTNAIKIIPTPGHTLQDVTILVYTNIGVIAITGDLFEKSEDLDNEYEWLQAGSDNASLQRRNRQKVLELADYIIPGHGPIFKVPDRFKKIIDNKAGNSAPLLGY
ncbi:unnamed protein product [Psylliodes chrysocephalus]|uniref:Metallo-beta-lactamase domain-containing protein 1 n=1 Tax=Psylliodes chrysocephalus TaxID=3402493 RepID=A0A9P0D978_9CUCU|nr:unnamed protein product [Psylliodes chrysocephala]